MQKGSTCNKKKNVYISAGKPLSSSFMIPKQGCKIKHEFHIQIRRIKINLTRES